MSDLEEAERQSRESIQEKEASLLDAERRQCEAGQQLERAVEAAKTQVWELSLALSQAQGQAQGLEDRLGLAEGRETGDRAQAEGPVVGGASWPGGGRPDGAVLQPRGSPAVPLAVEDLPSSQRYFCVLYFTRLSKANQSVNMIYFGTCH